MNKKNMDLIKCGWPNCGEQYEINNIYASNGGSVKSAVSNSAKCPRCGNFNKI